MARAANLESSVSKNISKLPRPRTLAANSPPTYNYCGEKSERAAVRPLSEDEERDDRSEYFYIWVSVG